MTQDRINTLARKNVLRQLTEAFTELHSPNSADDAETSESADPLSECVHGVLRDFYSPPPHRASDALLRRANDSLSLLKFCFRVRADIGASVCTTVFDVLLPKPNDTVDDVRKELNDVVVPFTALLRNYVNEQRPQNT